MRSWRYVECSRSNPSCPTWRNFLAANGQANDQSDAAGPRMRTRVKIGAEPVPKLLGLRDAVLGELAAPLEHEQGLAHVLGRRGRVGRVQGAGRVDRRQRRRQGECGPVGMRAGGRRRIAGARCGTCWLGGAAPRRGLDLHLAVDAGKVPALFQDRCGRARTRLGPGERVKTCKGGSAPGSACLSSAEACRWPPRCRCRRPPPSVTRGRGARAPSAKTFASSPPRQSAGRGRTCVSKLRVMSRSRCSWMALRNGTVDPFWG